MTHPKPWYAFLTGNRGTVAIGRVSLVLLLGLAVYFWLARPVAEFPPTLQEVIYGLLAYNLGGKFAGRKNES